MRNWFWILVGLLSGCASTSVMQTDANTIALTTAAAPICGSAGAQKVAYQRAAIETINHGFDRFIIVGGAAENNVKVVGTTPVQATTYGSVSGSIYGNSFSGSGSSNTFVTGGQPIIAGSHDQQLLVKMYKDDDPLAASAVPARGVLGPDWATIVQKPPQVC